MRRDCFRGVTPYFGFLEGRTSVVPWQDIAGIGNVLRHNYYDVNIDIIVKLRGHPLDQLEQAILALLAKYDPEGREFRDRN